MADHLELLKRGYEAWNAGNLDELLSLCHPEITIRPLLGAVVGAAAYHGRDGARELFAVAHAAWEEFRIEPEELVDAGDRVVALINVRVRAKGGISLDGRVAHVAEFSDGLIIRLEGFRDRAEAIASVSS